MVIGQLDLSNRLDVLTYSDLIFATRLIDASKTHHEEELLLRSQSWLGLLLLFITFLLGARRLGLRRIDFKSPDVPGLFEGPHSHFIICIVLVDKSRLNQSGNLLRRLWREVNFFDD